MTLRSLKEMPSPEIFSKEQINLVRRNDLKQEAIKNIFILGEGLDPVKETQKRINCPKENFTEEQYIVYVNACNQLACIKIREREAQITWIRWFFNITDADLIDYKQEEISQKVADEVDNRIFEELSK